MRARLMAGVPAAVVFLLACDGGGSSLGPPKAEITGTWDATSSHYVSTAAPAQSVDVVAQLGATVTLVLDANNRFTYTMTPAGGAPEVVSGTWQASADVFTLTAAGTTTTWQWNYTLSSTTLTLTGADGEYDFNGDGTLEAAKWSLSLSR